MQQQSQIFVFSTQWANKGAEAVLQGHFPSIIAYHCAQPGTKKFLEVRFSRIQIFLGKHSRILLFKILEIPAQIEPI